MTAILAKMTISFAIDTKKGAGKKLCLLRVEKVGGGNNNNVEYGALNCQSGFLHRIS